MESSEAMTDPITAQTELLEQCAECHLLRGANERIRELESMDDYKPDPDAVPAREAELRAKLAEAEEELHERRARAMCTNYYSDNDDNAHGGAMYCGQCYRLVKERLATVEKERDLASEGHIVAVRTVCSIMGGKVEGHAPTSIDYLQRLRELVDAEGKASSVAGLRDVNSSLLTRLAEVEKERDEWRVEHRAMRQQRDEAQDKCRRTIMQNERIRDRLGWDESMELNERLNEYEQLQAECERLRESEKANAASAWASNDICNDLNRLYTMAKRRADTAEAVLQEIADLPELSEHKFDWPRVRALAHLSSKASEGDPNHD